MTHIDIKFMMIPILLNEVFSMELSRFYWIEPLHQSYLYSNIESNVC